MYIYLPIIARQLLGKNVAATMNTHATTAELLGGSFSMWSVSHQRKVRDEFFQELLVMLLYMSY
jgi:hypothetical protein